MSSVIAVVKSIVGQVFAVSPEGIRRVLIEGDRLFTGDQLDTGPAGAVTLELADGRTLDLGRDTQWSANAPDSSTDLAQATAQAAPSVEELQQAIAAGADPTSFTPKRWRSQRVSIEPPELAKRVPVVPPGAATASWCWMPRPAASTRLSVSRPKA